MFGGKVTSILTISCFLTFPAIAGNRAIDPVDDYLNALSATVPNAEFTVGGKSQSFVSAVKSILSTGHKDKWGVYKTLSLEQNDDKYIARHPDSPLQLNTYNGMDISFNPNIVTSDVAFGLFRTLALARATFKLGTCLPWDLSYKDIRSLSYEDFWGDNGIVKSFAALEAAKSKLKSKLKANTYQWETLLFFTRFYDGEKDWAGDRSLYRFSYPYTKGETTLTVRSLVRANVLHDDRLKQLLSLIRGTTRMLSSPTAVCFVDPDANCSNFVKEMKTKKVNNFATTLTVDMDKNEEHAYVGYDF